VRILVTGAAGFIGSHIANSYAASGYEVFGIDNYENDLFFEVDDRVKMFRKDIRDRVDIAKIMREVKPDLVNHHAAKIDPRSSLSRPAEDTLTNYVGTINVVDCAAIAGCEKFIFASSCAVYGDVGAASEMIEGQVEFPNCPYGISKLASEKYVRLATKFKDMQAVVFRYPNVYGPDQHGTRSTGVIAIFAYQMARGERITIYGDGTAQYQYCEIHDIVQANHDAQKYMSDNRGNPFLLVNLAAPAVSVNDIAGMVQTQFKDYDICPIFAKPRSGEQYSITMSGAAAKQMLDWEPTISVQEGIVHVAEEAKIQLANS